jgi:pimeloyl-ACP methyl ester carboxylesterase
MSESDVVPSSSSSCIQFTLLLFTELVSQNFLRVVTIFDFLLLSTYSPVWDYPSQEPMAPILDGLSFIRIVFANVIFTFRRSSGIWPDVAISLITGLSVFFVYNLVFSWSLFLMSITVVSCEFASCFWSADRRRQRRLWVHNAEFRIATFRRNPFQRSNRRSLLLPLLASNSPAAPQAVPPSPTLASQKNIVPLNEHLVSTFTDVIPHVEGYRAEKKVLHVHSIQSTVAVSNDCVVFLHQFGSGAFTWQSVMSELAGSSASLVAFDRVAHGMTFPDQHAIVEYVEDATPHGEDLSQVVHFNEAIQSEEFDSTLVDELVGDKSVVFVSCGGSGARIALLYTRKHPERVRGMVLISPYGINSAGGVPSILKSVASASVGRALIVSMARSEILQVIPHRGWHSPNIPEKVLDTYARSVEVPGWEDCMLGYLERPATEVDVCVQPHVPCLIVEGEYDRCRDSSEEYVLLKNKMGQHVQSVSIPEVGAWPQEEKPKEVGEIINQFLRSIR